MAVFVGAISKFGNAGVAAPDCAGDVVVNKFVATLTAAQLVINTVCELGILPAGCTVTDAVLRATDFDSGGPTGTLDVGLMSGTPGTEDVARTVGAELFAASTIAQAGGSVAMAVTLRHAIAPVPYDRALGLLIKAAPTTAADATFTLICYISAERTPA